MIEIVALSGVAEVQPGDDLAQVLRTALARYDLPPSCLTAIVNSG